MDKTHFLVPFSTILSVVKMRFVSNIKMPVVLFLFEQNFK